MELNFTFKFCNYLELFCSSRRKYAKNQPSCLVISRRSFAKDGRENIQRLLLYLRTQIQEMDENVSRAVGQNSLGNNNLNFRLPRDLVVLFKTAANLRTNRRQAENVLGWVQPFSKPKRSYVDWGLDPEGLVLNGATLSLHFFQVRRL